MRKSFVLIACATVPLGCALAFAARLMQVAHVNTAPPVESSRKRQPAGPSELVGQKSTSAELSSEAQTIAGASGHPHVLRTPPEFDGFGTWDPARQLDAVTDMQRNPHLSPSMRDFLVNLASDPSRRAVLRNNAANALGIQEPPVKGWLERLAKQALDPQETPVWRDYALQHLSDQMAAYHARIAQGRGISDDVTGGFEPGQYVTVLRSLAASESTIAGTALLHLNRLNQEAGPVIEAGEYNELVKRVIENDGVDIGAKVTAFGILGLRGEAADAAIARRFLNHPSADMRRAAVAALGHLGTSADIEAIAEVDSGGDKAVDMAKAGARKRLSRSQATPSE